MRRLGWVLIAFLVIASAATSQTISPVIVEYPERARGSFQIRNDSFVPITVVLEPKSFSVDAQGEPVYRPLDPEIRVELSAKSFRVGAEQTYTVFYKAQSERVPAWFTIYAAVTGPTTPQGIKLILELPHTVYLLTRQPLESQSVVVHRAGRLSPRPQVALEVENRSERFARVQEVEISSSSGKKSYPGFPFFPGQRRTLLFDWDQPGVPGMVVLKFHKFKVEHAIASVTRSP